MIVLAFKICYCICLTCSFPKRFSLCLLDVNMLLMTRGKTKLLHTNGSSYHKWAYNEPITYLASEKVSILVFKLYKFHFPVEVVWHALFLLNYKLSSSDLLHLNVNVFQDQSCKI